MDGRNCTGRTISLLNDSGDAASTKHPLQPARIQLPPLAATAAAAAHSRASSCASTPSLEPQTPQLVRSNSDDSVRGALSHSSESPVTPSWGSFDQAVARHHRPHPTYYTLPHHYSYHKMEGQDGSSMYPPIPDATSVMPSAYPMPPHLPQQMVPQAPMQPQHQPYRTSTSPSSEPSRVSNVSGASTAKAQPKKNQYPCPMAKQVGCTDFFTTSGHAARHAKKHTGKKDAFCPECNKAFTRKDNMEQHRRTHQNGRGARSSDEGKVKKPTKPAPKKNSVKTDHHLEAAVEQQLADDPQQGQMPTQPNAVQPQPAVAQMQPPLVDQNLMIQPSAAGGMPYFLGNTVDSGPIPSLPMAMPELNGVRPPLQRSNFLNSLEYMPTLNAAQATFSDPDSLHYSYPSPGLSNGLNSLALAASEHQRRQSEEKAAQSPSDETPSETP